MEYKKRFSEIKIDEEFVPKYVLEDGREVAMKKNSAKLETILSELCLVYNEDLDRPKVIRLGDSLGRKKLMH